jgi:hypothetical protein
MAKRLLTTMQAQDLVVTVHKEGKATKHHNTRKLPGPIEVEAEVPSNCALIPFLLPFTD